MEIAGLRAETLFMGENEMKTFVMAVLGIVLIATSAFPFSLAASKTPPNNGWGSELGHAIGGMLMAGTATALVDHCWAEKAAHRGLIGFGISAASGFVGEGLQWASGGYFSLLDALSHAAGAAIGAYVTDEFILIPVVKIAGSDTTVGVFTRFEF